MDPAAPKRVEQPAFLTLLNAQEDGTLVAELNDRLIELVNTMHQEQTSRGGKPRGSLSIAFDFKLDHTGVMEVSADVKVKEPKTERSRSIFYRMSDNSLSPNNPKQITMDLGAPREVNAPQQAMRVV